MKCRSKENMVHFMPKELQSNDAEIPCSRLITKLRNIDVLMLKWVTFHISGTTCHGLHILFLWVTILYNFQSFVALINSLYVLWVLIFPNHLSSLCPFQKFVKRLWIVLGEISYKKKKKWFRSLFITCDECVEPVGHTRAYAI